MQHSTDLVPAHAQLLLRVADEAADVRPDQRDPEPGRLIRLELQTKVREDFTITEKATHWLNCSMPMMERLMLSQLEKLSPSQCATQPPEPTNVDLGSSS